MKTEEELLYMNDFYWAMVRWQDGLSQHERHRWFGTAFSPQGENNYSRGTWWMNRAFDRLVEEERL